MNPIARMLIDMARFYGYEIEDRQLEMYVEALSQFPAEAVLGAGRNYVRNPKNERFPIPPHKILIGLIPMEADQRSLAIEAASRAMSAVRKFGWCQQRSAREYIGELGWQAVQRFGDWEYVCQHLGTHTLPLTTFQAQIRDLCESTIKLGDAGIFDEPIGLPEKPRSGELSSIKDTLDQVMIEAIKLKKPEVSKEDKK